MSSLRILVVATKAPWPPVDGGRLVLLNTIEALAEAGHHIDLVAPCTKAAGEAAAALNACCTPHLVETRPRSGAAAALAGLTRGVPLTVARHTLPAVREVVDRILAENRTDVIHAEQLHTLPQIENAEARGVLVVHRAHNVENHLWAFSSRHRNPMTSSLLALETRRMSAYEVFALETTACTVALTEPDRRSLSALVPGATVHTVPAPFAAELSAGDELPCAADVPEVAVRMADAQPHVRGLARVDDVPGRVERQRDRFFVVDVLALLGGSHRNLFV